MQRFRLLAVDPALAESGFLVAEVTATGKHHPHVAWLDGGTVRTDPRKPIVERLALLYRSTVLWHDMTTGHTGTDREGRAVAAPTIHAVIEDAGDIMWGPSAKSLYVMGLGVGTILSALALRLDTRHLTLIRPRDYLPRRPSNTSQKQHHLHTVEAGRALLPQALSTASEHVCMAAYLASWWLQHSPDWRD